MSAATGGCTKAWTLRCRWPWTPTSSGPWPSPLPTHLTDAEQLPYTLAIHAGKGANPHCHLMISERTNDDLERSAEHWFKRYNAAEPDAGGARKSTALTSERMAPRDAGGVGRAEQRGAPGGRARDPDRPPQPRSPRHRARARYSPRASCAGDGSAGHPDRAGAARARHQPGQ